MTPLDEFRAVLDLEGLAQTSGQLEFGLIYVRAGYVTFPHETWTDFVVIILDWWLTELFSLIIGKATACNLYFVDGPYHMHVEQVSDGQWMFQCVEHTQKGEITKHSFTVSPGVVLRELLHVSQEVMTNCTESGWTSHNLDELQLAYRKLSEYPQ